MAEDVLDFTAFDECDPEAWEETTPQSVSRWHRLYEEIHAPSARKLVSPSEQQFRKRKLARYRVVYEPTSGAIRLETELEERFRRLAEQWRKETRHSSSVNRMAMHPAYQQIVGMGRDALPLILHELQRTRGHWLWALYAINGEDVAPEGSTFEEAVDAWLEWGRRQHHI